ncbi:MAG: 2-oxoglutarate and iron-dependent oxygenase domain-containing protein, partial [Pseudomonadota bacterium]
DGVTKALSQPIPASQQALDLDAADLPMIDLSPLFTGDETGDETGIDSVAAAIGAAAEETGFFYITGHGISQEMIDGAYAASREFHAQPRDYKMRYYVGLSTHHRGYSPPDELNIEGKPEQVNHHEVFDLSYEAPGDHPDCLAGYRMTGPNPWPDLPGFKSRVQGYYDAVFGVGLAMMKAIERYLELAPGDITQHITAPTSQLRLLHYLANDAPMDEDNVGIGAHSDFECFTILHQGGPGLQVMGVDDKWRRAIPVPEAFIVNIGDCLETWTGGRFKSTQHRVPNMGRERYSMPLFFGLDYHTVVEPAPKFRTPEAVEKYPPFVAGEHLMGQTIGGFRYLQTLRDQGHLNPTYRTGENPFKRDAKPLDEE